MTGVQTCALPIYKGGQQIDQGHTFSKQQVNPELQGCSVPKPQLSLPYIMPPPFSYPYAVAQTPAARAGPNGGHTAGPLQSPRVSARPPRAPHLVSSGMLLLSSQLSWAWAGSCAPPAAGSPESE